MSQIAALSFIRFTRSLAVCVAERGIYHAMREDCNFVFSQQDPAGRVTHALAMGIPRTWHKDRIAIMDRGTVGGSEAFSC